MRLTRNNRTILILLGLIGIKTISCVPPVYHTADVKPGTSYTVGGGYLDYNYYFPQGLDGGTALEAASGYRLDMVFRYSGGKRFIEMGHPAKTWEHLAIVAQAGAMVTEGEGARGFFDLPGDSSKKVLPWLETALQYEVLENPSISIQAGLFFFYDATVTFLVGIPIKNREIATLGLKTQWLYMPASVFLTLHPLKRLHLYLQTNPRTWISPEWELQAGAGFDLINK